MEKYEAPEIEVIKFNTDDVITTSRGDTELPEEPVDGGL